MIRVLVLAAIPLVHAMLPLDGAQLVPTPLAPPSLTPVAARQYIAHCEAAKGFTVVTVNARDALVLGCVKFGIERVPIDEDPE